MKPERIQRNRTRGWRMPKNAKYVGRPSKYSNPYKMTDGLARQEAVDRFNWWIKEKIEQDPEYLKELQADLRGKNLACWCPIGQPCHANILLWIANTM